MKIVSPSELDQSNPGTWPIYYKVLVWILLVFIIIFAFNYFFVKDMIMEQDSNERNIEERKTKFTQLYQYTLDLDVYRERSGELIRKLDGLLVYLPLENEIASLIDDVYRKASDSDININGFMPSTDYISQEYYDIARISLNTNTYFDSFAEFSERLNHLDQIMNISDFSLIIMNDDEDDLFGENGLVVSSQLQTYVYNGDIEALRNGEIPSKKEEENK